ncbi:O-antigen ligase family protein [Streptomyces sp. NPDC057386]|uniref:O-antigen ligase family protein n=1 Tax=unclassified Streptomyces TaxID=2593676 RepID=UPI0036430DDA
MTRAMVLDRHTALGVGTAMVATAAGLWVSGRSMPLGLAVLLGVPVLVWLTVAAVQRPVLAVSAVALIPMTGNVEVPLSTHLSKVLIAAAVVVVVTARVRGHGQRLGWSPIAALLAALVVSALLSTLTSFDVPSSLRQDANYLIGLALVVAIVMATVDVDDLLMLAVSVSVGGAVLCATALTSVSDLRADYDATLVVNRPRGIFTQPNQLGMAAAIVLCFSVGVSVLAARRRRAPLAVLTGVCAALALAALVLSLSRGAWFGAGLGLVVLAVLLPEARRPLMVSVTLGLAAVVGYVATRTQLAARNIVTERLESIVSWRSNPYDERPALWGEAIDQLVGHPVLGTGPDAFPAAANQGATVTPARGWDHAHNLFLGLGAEQGVLGLTLLAAVMGVGAWEALRNRRMPDRPPGEGGAREPPVLALTVRSVSAAATAALTAVLGQGVVDYPLRNPVLQVMTWLVIGLLAACARVRSARRDGDPSVGRST